MKKIKDDASIVKSVRQFSGVKTFIGFKHDDANVTGNILIIEDKNTIYSFNTHDILAERKMPDGRYVFEVRIGSIGYKSSVIRVEQDDLNFLTLLDMGIAVPPAPRRGDPELAGIDDIEELKKQNPKQLSLKAVATHWSESCNLSNTPSYNNCAHYLSEAFIKAGYDELIRRNSEGKGIFTQWCDTITPPYRVNGNARPIRAKDMKEWFNSKAKKKATTSQNSSTRANCSDGNCCWQYR